MKIKKKIRDLPRNEKIIKVKQILSRNNINLKFNKWQKSMKPLKLKYKHLDKNSNNFKINMTIFNNFKRNRKKQKNNSKSNKTIFHKIK